MKKTEFRFALILLLTVAAVLTLAVASGAEPAVTYEGERLISVDPGVYTDADLFGGFRDILPGDELTETIIAENLARDYDYIKVFLKAIPHDEENNPLSPGVLEEIRRDERRGEMSELEYMLDFLSQITMTITADGEIFRDRVSMNGYVGDPVDGVLVAELEKNEVIDVSVHLSVPTDLDERYADRIGELDWVFLVEGFNRPTPPPEIPSLLTVRKVWVDNGHERPESVTIQLLKDGEVYDTKILSEKDHWTYTWVKPDEKADWEIVEIDVPEGYEVSYRNVSHTTVITNTGIGIPSDEDPELPDSGDKDAPDAGDQGDTGNPDDADDADDQGDTGNPDDADDAGDQGDTDGAGGTGGSDAPAAPVSLTVRKAWDDNNSRKRPKTAMITLYRGETAVETVSLGDWNNWSYTWHGLDGNECWQAVEDDVPKGYAPVYSYENGVVTITNTAILIQTGQLNWPVPVMGGLGVVLVVGGILFMTKKRRNDEE